jgi:hypothetical protein
MLSLLSEADTLEYLEERSGTTTRDLDDHRD